MNDQRLDPALSEWLREGPEQGPRHGLDRALAATRRVEQRPGWTFPRKWLPRPIAEWQPAIPAAALVGLLVLLAALLLVVLAIAIGGRPRHIDSPFGPAGDRLVAYQDGNEIVVSRIDSSERRAITLGVAYARSPTFSPDGKLVAFVAAPSPGLLGGALMVVPVDGSRAPVELSRGVTVVAANVSSLAWSPDGRHIAFAGQDGSVSRIYVAAIDGNTPSPLTDATAARDLPTWSADGTRIAFRERDPDGIRTRLRTMAVDGSDIQEVDLVVASDAFLSKLRWRPADFPISYTFSPGYGTPTSGQVSFYFGHTYEIWSQGTGGFADNGVPWAPDGSKLAMLTAADGVIVADYDASVPYNGQVRKLGPVADCWVDWVPDGSGLYGGSRGDCSRTVLIPLSQPTSPWYLPGSASGTASWQPLAK